MFNETRQSLPVAQMSRLRAECLEMVAHHLVEGTLLGQARSVAG